MSSHPNCPVAGYYCEVHHDDDYAKTKRTDVTDLTLRCGPHHELMTSGGWKTRKRHDGWATSAIRAGQHGSLRRPDPLTPA
ncbi:hypothetical protein C5U48_05735 [Mycolicibacter virginiensis]|uniref:HNH endonuclease n=1 Tax=Mycolicibacter virginiensis TaxID=1795032 RepID=A0A9X7IPS2_9MYCO|nr:hypothetical protein C5U48_05735 [Mycolicibacter virginiensis]